MTRWPMKLAIVFGLVISGLVIVLTLAFDDHPSAEVIPTHERKSLDSLRSSLPSFEAKRDTLVVHETTYVHVARHATEAARSTLAKADSIRTRADSLEMRAVVANDSLSLWKATALARDAETKMLRVTIDSLNVSLAAEDAARRAADERAALAETRRLALADLNDRIAADLAHANDCRILHVLRCPSRPTAYAAGVASGVILTGTLALVARR